MSGKLIELSSKQLRAIKQPGHSLTSRFKGVSLYRGIRGNKWRATIISDGVQTHIGNYDTEEEAARAYDEAAWKRWGHFCYQNFPPDVL